MTALVSKCTYHLSDLSTLCICRRICTYAEPKMREQQQQIIKNKYDCQIECSIHAYTYVQIQDVQHPTLDFVFLNISRNCCYFSVLNFLISNF